MDKDNAGKNPKGWDIRKLVDDIDKGFAAHEIESLEHIEPLEDMFRRNPDSAIEKLAEFYNTALDHAYTDEKGTNLRSFIQGFAGGPLETIPWKLYTIVGEHYPGLSRQQKNNALSKIVVGIFDRLNWGYVKGTVGSGHTTGIREPLLLSDIATVRPLYWPGLDEGKALIKRFQNFSELREELMDENGLFDRRRVVSDFLVAYALLRSDFCSWGEEYAKTANPNFLQRTLKGIVALRFARIKKEQKDEKPEDGQLELFNQYEEKIKDSVKRLKQLLPECLHDRIEPLRQEHDWADSKLFR